MNEVGGSECVEGLQGGRGGGSAWRGDVGVARLGGRLKEGELVDGAHRAVA
jgi:hypothetical protein